MKIIFTLFLFLISLNISFSQTKWKRSEPIVEVKKSIFKSTQAFNLHTAEILPSGDLFYGISHRFNGPVSDGYSTLFGLDNGAIMRMILAYGLNDNLMFTLGRTNNEANVDFQIKYKIFHSEFLKLPIMLSINAGGAYIGKPQVEIKKSSKEYQYFSSIIFNTILFDNLAIGFNPSYNYNTIPHCDCNTYSILLGSYLQYYFNDDMTSIILESINTIDGWRGDGINKKFDTYSLGVEFETGGHFFKLLLSNNNLINQSQIFNGSNNAFTLENLVFGFQITRNFGL